ncbi:hypothetical protein OZX74_00150 [Bifidobacterium sp. ESL0798]|uniref:hypothetical protein n=1 Tax=Bifidobacterium sp. ESL0798 TaxID=2983235 RepID=UPI0023F8A05D|nr:hypothetical protein [Bifidobacterium sp. ESL0798]WEV74033.1 hypothetical protein OZX74_00150 [Bifidobacterium sp. ESL0798]
MDKNKQSRDWMLTIPAKEHRKDELAKFFKEIGKGAVFQKEEGGKTGYLHYQCFLQLESPMRWATLKSHLKKAGYDDAHIEPRAASVADCVNYCTKDETSVDEPVYIGDIKMNDHQGERTDLSDLRAQVLAGKSVNDVLLDDESSKAARYTKWLNELAAARDQREYGQKMRDVDVHYLWGAPGVGKTRYVYERYPIGDIYRVTDYRHPFDEYERQKILVLDEYDSQFEWEKLLVYLDRYPLMLPARYHNRQACYRTVWLLSNLPLDEQYIAVHGERRKALTRRIAESLHMVENGKIISRQSNVVV